MLNGLDVAVLGFIYKQCFLLGSSFGFGALEGGVMYTLLIALGVVKVKESKSKREVKKR